MSDALLQPEERVLSTLEADGSRRWLSPRLSKGKWWKRRRNFAYLLIAFFLTLPWVRIGGEPIVLLDIANRQFHILGQTFLPTDTVLLAILVLMIGVGVFFFTAVFGRVFCGWFCPHSVYLEFVYRPIERFFTGRVGVGGKPTKEVPGWKKLAMYVVFLMISVHLAQTFVSYFVGAYQLSEWIWFSWPWEHPVAFGVVAVCTAWIMWDMAFWREQMCIVGCPYGRFQSVMLDRQSSIVTYDPQRGEPRGKPRRAKKGSDTPLPVLGDCIDCNMCVHVCPTGIDIRDGLQLECIHCTQCIDACDTVMDQVKRPRGLIRYASQAEVDGEPKRLLRPRVVLYPAVLCILAGLFGFALFSQPTTDLTVLRGMGRPFAVLEAGEFAGKVENQLQVKLVNRTPEPRTYTIAVQTLDADGQPADPLDARRTNDDAITLATSEIHTEPIRLLIDPMTYDRGRLNAVVVVTDDLGDTVREDVLLRGPATLPSPNTDTDS
ncbi:MAG: cytochrome c oxidase accessory protein CcoG [Planctomycetota bacterium]